MSERLEEMAGELSEHIIEIVDDYELTPNEVLAVLELFTVSVFIQLDHSTNISFGEIARIYSESISRYATKQQTHAQPEGVH
jgi:hypothetical protein